MTDALAIPRHLLRDPNNPLAAENRRAIMGSNSELTEDHRRALGFHHLSKYKQALEKKKTADAELKNVCKVAKADGVSNDDLKQMIALESPEGEAALQAELKRKLEVARWCGAPVGTQFDFLDQPDRTPLADRAFEEGKRAGMKGETCISPHTGEAEQEWIRGWHEGQGTLMAALDLTKAAKAAEAEESEEEAAEEAPKKRRGRPRKNAAANGHAETEDDPHREAKERDAAEFEAPAFAG